jgi:hypothetical protein
MKDIEKIKELLSQAVELIENNIEVAQNLDLTHMCETIDSFIYELDEIGDFEQYEDEGPEYDGAGFSEEDRIVNGQYQNPEQ